MEADLLVIGAGPAGISAALTAERSGADVVLIDESFSLGGQLRQQTQYFSNLPEKYENDSGISLKEKLEEQLFHSTVQFLTNHTMIGSYKNGSIGATNGKQTIEIRAKKNIIATGASEKVKIFPGWTLPGVMTAGAAQILINREFVLPGQHAIIYGSNTFSLEVAKQLRDCNISIIAIVEEGDEVQCKDEGLLRELGNTPIWTNSAIVSARGSGEVEKVSIKTAERFIEVDADLICISNGFEPILEPFAILNCLFSYHIELGGWVPKYNPHFQTTNPSCFVAGNAAGITELGPILLSGEIAAWSALESIGMISQAEAEKKRNKLWKEIAATEDGKVLQARVKLMRKFDSDPKLDSVPILDKIRKGEINDGPIDHRMPL